MSRPDLSEHDVVAALRGLDAHLPTLPEADIDGAVREGGRRRRRRRAGWVAGATAVAVGAGGFGYAVLRPGGELRPAGPTTVSATGPRTPASGVGMCRDDTATLPTPRGAFTLRLDAAGVPTVVAPDGAALPLVQANGTNGVSLFRVPSELAAAAQPLSGLATAPRIEALLVGVTAPGAYDAVLTPARGASFAAPSAAGPLTVRQRCQVVLASVPASYGFGTGSDLIFRTGSREASASRTVTGEDEVVHSASGYPVDTVRLGSPPYALTVTVVGEAGYVAVPVAGGSIVNLGFRAETPGAMFGWGRNDVEGPADIFWVAWLPGRVSTVEVPVRAGRAVADAPVTAYAAAADVTLVAVHLRVELREYEPFVNPMDAPVTWSDANGVRKAQRVPLVGDQRTPAVAVGGGTFQGRISQVGGDRLCLAAPAASGDCFAVAAPSVTAGHAVGECVEVDYMPANPSLGLGRGTVTAVRPSTVCDTWKRGTATSR